MMCYSGINKVWRRVNGPTIQLQHSTKHCEHRGRCIMSWNDGPPPRTFRLILWKVRSENKAYACSMQQILLLKYLNPGGMIEPEVIVFW